MPIPSAEDLLSARPDQTRPGTVADDGHSQNDHETAGLTLDAREISQLTSTWVSPWMAGSADCIVQFKTNPSGAVASFETRERHIPVFGRMDYR